MARTALLPPAAFRRDASVGQRSAATRFFQPRFRGLVRLCCPQPMQPLRRRFQTHRLFLYGLPGVGSHQPLEQVERPAVRTGKTRDGCRPSRLRKLATRYYQVTHTAIRRYDRHHLILGDRYEANAPLPIEVVESALPFVDVLCFQDFKDPVAHLAQWHRQTGKPVLWADGAKNVPDMASAPDSKSATADNGMPTCSRDCATTPAASAPTCAAPTCAIAPAIAACATSSSDPTTRIWRQSKRPIEKTKQWAAAF